jgi:hypothetical protein
VRLVRGTAVPLQLLLPVPHRPLARRRVVRLADVVGRAHAGYGSDVRYSGLGRLGVAAAGFRFGVGRRHPKSVDCIELAARCRHRSIRSVEQADWNSILRPGRAMAPAREMEGQVMSYRRARRVSALRLVVVSRDPLAPDTDLHHRMIRECWVDCRTDGTSGRDEKDVGVRSCSCGVAVWLRRKVLLRMAHGDRGANSREFRNPILFGVARQQGCARTRMVLSAGTNVQQQLNGRGRYVECPALSFK